MSFRRLGLIAAGVLFAAFALAADEIAVPPLQARVTDLTSTLTASQLQGLESRLREFESAKGSQIAVLLLPTTQPETIEQYSIRVADAWKIGRARVDDGVILVIAKNDRKLRVEVGRGLEGAIPDAIAKRVVSDVITPHLRNGDFYGGVAAGADALMKLIGGESLPPPKALAGAERAGENYFVLYILLFLVVFLVSGGVLVWLLGRLLGAAVTAGVVFFTFAMFAGATIGMAIFCAVFAFLFTLFVGASGSSAGRGGWSSDRSSGGWSSGGSSGGGFGGGDSGGFGGGGGGFSGGGASGSW